MTRGGYTMNSLVPSPVLQPETRSVPSTEDPAALTNCMDAVVTFVNGRGETERGTLISCGRSKLVMEVYNPDSVTQVSEVLRGLTVRSGTQVAYSGDVTVISLLNAGPMLVVSAALTGEWRDFAMSRGSPAEASESARRFVHQWNRHFHVRKEFQLLISEIHAFLRETRRWANQIDLSAVLPREDNGTRIKADVFDELAQPILHQLQGYLAWYESECRHIAPEHQEQHRHFAQSTLHPLLLQSPFVYRAFNKPLGYAGDYEIVNQILGDPRCGDGAYAQIINAAFLAEPVAQAHRNRVRILEELLQRHAQQVSAQGRALKVLNIGCGPAAEIQRFVAAGGAPAEFTLVDFSQAALQHAQERIEAASPRDSATRLTYVNASVQDLLRRGDSRDGPMAGVPWDFDLVYCAGLFDYLPDKVCARLLRHLDSRLRPGGTVVATNVHASDPNRLMIEHLLEWHLIRRNELQLERLRPARTARTSLYTDETGVNVFVEFRVAAEDGQ